MFFLFIILGALLIVNMLIAMMGNTYLKVAETEKEWTRQVELFVFEHLSWPTLFLHKEQLAYTEAIVLACQNEQRLLYVYPVDHVFLLRV